MCQVWRFTSMCIVYIGIVAYSPINIIIAIVVIIIILILII